MAAKKKKIQVTAKVGFVDSLTGKGFERGDVIDGWDEERARHYEGRGLVIVKEEAPAKKRTPKEDPQMTIADTPSEPNPEETENQPGPEVTKPDTGPSEQK